MTTPSACPTDADQPCRPAPPPGHPHKRALGWPVGAAGGFQLTLQRHYLTMPILTVLLITFGGAAASASTITNRDGKDLTITLIEGNKRAEHVLKPNVALTDVCADGCTVRFNAGQGETEYRLDGNELVSIEAGYLYFDGVAAAPLDASPAEKPDARRNRPPTRR